MNMSKKAISTIGLIVLTVLSTSIAWMPSAHYEVTSGYAIDFKSKDPSGSFKTMDGTVEFDEAQVKYVKDMNLNCIRFEAFWGKDHSIYNLCDKYGILAMVGFSCQWEWEDYIGTPCTDNFGCAVDGTSIALLSSYWKHQIMWLRNRSIQNSLK